MARSRKILIAGALGVAALALIGTGAGATFTNSVNATETITAGTMNLQITDGAGGAVSTDGHSVTLSALAPTGSTFETDHKVITVKNTGNITVKSLAFQMSESHVGTANNNALLAQTNVCIESTDTSGGPWTEGNGPLSTAVALTPTVGQNPVTLVPGQSMTFSVDFYAGQDSSQCKPITSDGSKTSTAWNGYQGHGYQTPASLTNAAQGGVVNPTLTFSFTG
jgi:hypothetical protein